MNTATTGALWREAAGALPNTYHRNRLRRILDDDYGAVRGTGAHRADGFIGAHGVSFLTVV